MKRRSFLSLLGMAAIAAPLARFLPVAAEPAVPVAADIVVPSSIAPVVGMRGLPYLINNTGNYFGFTRLPRNFYGPVVSKEEIAERERQWYDSLPQNRSLIPEDYRRG